MIRKIEIFPGGAYSKYVKVLLKNADRPAAKKEDKVINEPPSLIERKRWIM